MFNQCLNMHCTGRQTAQRGDADWTGVSVVAYIRGYLLQARSILLQQGLISIRQNYVILILPV